MRRYWIRGEITLLARRGAVIIDTETTDFEGLAIEIAVVDFKTGNVLVESLIEPEGSAITAGASAVHGLSDRDVAGAPTLADLAPKLRAVLRGRPVIAYNADFDRGVLNRHAEAAGIAPVVGDGQWWCAMRARSDFNGERRLRKLDGGHRAAGDCLATRALLHTMKARSTRVA
ncbi:MAG: DNA polymerase-3 subunit epsilon [Rhodococcus sp. (in: high G+C Gram-positive bacteria)]